MKKSESEEYRDEVKELLQELSDKCDLAGFQLVAIILNGSPKDCEVVTPIDAWHPNYVEHFKRGCVTCINTAEKMCADLSLLIFETKESGRVQ